MNKQEALALKPGDIIICAQKENEEILKANGFVLTRQLIEGQEYIFKEISGFDNDFIKIEGFEHSFVIHRFKLKEKEMEQKKNVFAVGVKVRIADNLVRLPDGPGLNPEMGAYSGKDAIIKEFTHGGKFVRLDVDNADWHWDLRWLTIIEDKKPLRDAKGRFIKKEAVVKPVPPKKEEKKNDEQVRAKLRAEVGDNAGTCSYAKQFVDGTFEMHVRDVCHARVNNYAKELKDIAYLACDVEGHLKRIGNKEAYKQFIKWIVNSPQFGPHILTKNVDECFDKGILINVQSTISQVATTCIAIRTGSEYSNTLSLWKRLNDDGVDGFDAWIVSKMFQEKGKLFVASSNSGGHHVWAENFPLGCFLDVKKNGLKKVNVQPYAKAGAERYHVFATFGQDKYDYGQNLADSLRNNIKKHLPKLFAQVKWGQPAPTVTYKDIVVLCDKLFG